MENKKQPRSLRSRLLATILLCWVLPVLSVMVLAGVLVGRSYEQSAQQALQSRAENALEQLQIRMETVFEASKSVSYDGVVRNSYRLYQQNGDSAALYRTVTDYLNQNFTRDERIPAAFLSYWEAGEIRPYAASRGDFGYSSQKEYRENIEADVLKRMADVDTDILLLEYGGELYVARNLLDSHFRPYATVVLLCDRALLFQSLQPVKEMGQVWLSLDGRLLLDGEGNLATREEPGEEGWQLFETRSGAHVFRLAASIEDFVFWRDVPQIQQATLLILLLVLPLLVAMIFLFRRYVTRPVETMVEASGHLENGERGYVIDARPNSREFQTLYEHFNTMSTEMKHQFERSYLEQQALQQAQVKALQSQINPHFLNNTLEIINWEARIAENDRVSAMIEALSVMMDGALGRDGRGQIHLREELSYVDAYLYIIRQRLGERLEIRKEIDESLLERMVPRLILQPLVENAVEHDITERRGGELSLRVRREGEQLCLEVEHDGTMTPADRESIAEMLSSRVADTGLSAQVGLRNVKQRLELIYGEKGSLRVEQCGPDRILAGVRFPME